MPISWNEIRDRAVKFAKDWEGESSEDAEAKTFWDSFFNVFGITRRRVASFETPVKKSDGKGGFIDLLWKGVLVVEHKSRGKDLDRAYHQATDYFSGLKERDLPRYVLVSDFARFRLHDLEDGKQHEFQLKDLHKNVRLFGFIAGYETRFFGEQDPVNIAAAERLGKLHDQLKAVGYDGHPLEVFLVRLLFCLFAEDNSILEPQQLRELIELRSAEDGSDLAPLLANLFQVLNTHPEKRLKNLDEQLSAFAYINGKLFAEQLPLAAFNKTMRETLLDCSAINWSRISPAIFGALFQSIMDKTARRNLGAHYTSEGNILKALRPLFLDALRAEFERVKRDKKRLMAFHDKLARIRILDPACGCGNFLVIAYREIRLLELDVLRELYKAATTGLLDVSQILFVDVDQFYGIEIEEFPAQIAQVALWMTDHQMNLKVSEEFGQYFARLPLKKAPNILHGNALTTDWQTLIPPTDLTYIVGNPPFVGKKEQSALQKLDMSRVFRNDPGTGVLDFVTAWYRKATEYMTDNRAIKAAFVSTNSITQGEQVGVLWADLLKRGVIIHFAHRTFQWSSEARGKAAVHCVIIGFALHDTTDKQIFDYESPQSESHEIKAKTINPYLVDAPNTLLQKRMTPISHAPQMDFGSKAVDFGHLTLSEEEKADLLHKHPEAASLVRPFIGSEEFINGTRRYCLWLKNIPANEIRSFPLVMSRIEAVKSARLNSGKQQTKESAEFPTLFGEDRQPTTNYLLVPKVSSERRKYIPLGFCDPHLIINPTVLVVPGATLYDFGLLSSTMHMAWMRATAGRLESRYQYSNTIVYNNFPWPSNVTDKQRRTIQLAAQAVLDARNKYPSASLADLYDPLSMPPELTKAHHTLDRAVDATYGKTGFNTEADRVAFLFQLYQQITAPLDLEEPKPKRKRATKVAAS
jgi:hypothetical protein